MQNTSVNNILVRETELCSLAASRPTVDGAAKFDSQNIWLGKRRAHSERFHYAGRIDHNVLYHGSSRQIAVQTMRQRKPR